MAPHARQRSNLGILQPWERPLLQWLAGRLPAKVTPDQLTAIGLGGSCVVFLGYLLCSWHPAFIWLASVGLLVNWFGDSLDGTLARFRKIERPRYGYFIDHTTDLLTQVMFALGLGLSSYIRFEIACLALIVYLLMAVVTFVRVHVSGTLQIAFGGIGPTEVRVGMIILNAAIFFVPPKPILVLWAPLSLADLTVLAATCIAFIALLVLMRREARRLAMEDPTPLG